MNSMKKETLSASTRFAAGKRLLIVGGGPRTIGILERIGANSDLLRGEDLEIVIFDPWGPGAGRIWRSQQPQNLLMNSQAKDVTCYTDASVRCDGPISPGPSLEEWVYGIQRGERDIPEQCLEEEVSTFTGDSFASRRLFSYYLKDFFNGTRERLPGNVRVHLLEEEVVSLRGATVTLRSGEELDADAVLLSLGHADSLPQGEVSARADHAHRHGLTYFAPAQSHELNLDDIQPGQTVISNGMGLAFIDICSRLTEGRGGAFTDEGYVPSGREPIIWVGSRRGVPYHSKVTTTASGSWEPTLNFMDQNFWANLPDRIDFDRDLWPSIVKECEYSWNREVMANNGARPHRSPLEGGTDSIHVPEDRKLDFRIFDRPLAEGVSEEDIVAYIEDDIAHRTSQEFSESKTLFDTMVMINAELVRNVSISRLGGGASKWKSLFNFVCSGPPPHRLRQLLQLHRAGIVRFLGPQTRVELGPADFIASSSSGTRFVHADALIEAYLPRPTLQNTANELMRNLMHQGGIRESATQPGFIDIDAGFHVVDAGGRVRHNLWAVGPATAEIPAGAFARPGTDAAAFRRNDSLARDILQEIAAPARGGSVGASV